MADFFFQAQHRLPVGQLTRIIGVKVRLACHRKDFSGVHIHHDAGRTFFYIMLYYSNLQMLFHKVLDDLIDGQHQ